MSFLRKTEAVARLMMHRAELLNRRDDPADEEGFRRALRKAALKGWAMKPVIKANGMREGAINEERALDAASGHLEDLRHDNCATGGCVWML